MFTGVVVQNFSYVFQSTGGAQTITREEIRSFKKTWAEFSNPKTGLLEQSRLVPFLGVSSLRCGVCWTHSKVIISSEIEWDF